MTRDTMQQILGSAPGIKASKQRYQVASDHKLGVYVGQPGQAMVFRDVDSCELREGCVALTAREDGTVTYLMYDAVHGLSVRPPASDSDVEQRRPGFA